MKRMVKFAWLLSAALVVAVVAPLSAEAQVRMRPWEISIAGGPSFPVGDFGEIASTGYHVQGSVGFDAPSLPVGIRADLIWQEVQREDAGWFRQIGGLLNATFGVPFVFIEPYGLVGVGYIHTDEPTIILPDGSTIENDDTSFGFNAGLGMDFPFMGLAGFVEARYLNLFGGDQAEDFQVIPVSFGIRF